MAYRLKPQKFPVLQHRFSSPRIYGSSRNALRLLSCKPTAKNFFPENLRKFEKCLEAAVVQTRYIRVHRYIYRYVLYPGTQPRKSCLQSQWIRKTLLDHATSYKRGLSVCLSVTDETVRKTRIIIESFDEVDSDCKIDLPLF